MTVRPNVTSSDPNSVTRNRTKRSWPRTPSAKNAGGTRASDQNGSRPTADESVYVR